MGFFTRNRPRPSKWQADGTGVVSNGICGGDIQHGDSYSVRYIRPDMPGSMITVSFYAVEYDENPGEFVVQRHLEWLVCEDTADAHNTLVWSDDAYDDPMSGSCIPFTAGTQVFDSAEKAEEDARDSAEDALNRGHLHGWDGQPDWNAEAV
jgi:hypothetical protein